MEPFYADFGVSRAQLLLILEGIAGEPVTDCTVSPAAAGDRESEDQIVGQRQLTTFHYTILSGQEAEIALFVKRCVWKGVPESIHYRHLAGAGVPTPRLYGDCRNAEGQEVIFLEPLTAIGFRDDSEGEWRAMLSLLARLNACPITPAYAPTLYRYEQIGQIGGGTWISGLDANVSEDGLEAVLRGCGVAAEDLGPLTAAASAVFSLVRAQPQGLLHQDLRPDNFGWRGGREEMVVFDLHKNSRGPRFVDVAPYLSTPDWSPWAAFLDAPGDSDPSRTRREALTQHYLDEYARFGGARVSPAVFHAEVSALCWMHKITVLPWLAERGQSAHVEQVLDFLRQNAAGE